MDTSIVARRGNAKQRTKTGCATCRIRKIKCDENKPRCHKCVSTGRSCDYEPAFRVMTSELIRNTNHSIRSKVTLQPIQSAFTDFGPQDIDLLAHCFSTKTLFNVKLGCYEEAKQVLQASSTDPPIRHAVLSLRCLRKDLETSGNSLAYVTQQLPGYSYGIQQYNLALGSLASNLSSRGSREVKSALLCCQMFISIEQIRGNYDAMAQHLTRGLSIMHEYRARPNFSAMNDLMPAYHDRLPFLDVFIIKLFAAPCKFAEFPATSDASDSTPSACSRLLNGQPPNTRNRCTITPDVRTELKRIAASTLKFLDTVSQAESTEEALRLLAEKQALLGALKSWLLNLELTQTKIGLSAPEPLSQSFLRLFHAVLRLVLFGVLDSSPSLDAKLRAESDRLRSVAHNVGAKVRAYRMCGETG